MGGQEINIVFIVVVITLALYSLRGLRDGFIKTIFGMCTLFVAIGAGFLLGSDLRAVVTIFIITWLALWCVCFALNLMAKLPILDGLNKTAGLLVGLLRGFVTVWAWGLVLRIFVFTEIGKEIYVLVGRSRFLVVLYENNLLYEIGKGFM